jgi:hypothetical protein
MVYTIPNVKIKKCEKDYMSMLCPLFETKELSSDLKESFEKTLQYEPTVGFDNTFRGKAVYLMKSLDY